MNRLLLTLVLFTFWAFESNAQVSMLTRRETYNFSVGDTFVYGQWHYPAPESYLGYTQVIVTGKHYSPDSSVVYYNYLAPYLPLGVDSSYSNLDSLILQPNSITQWGIRDTAFIDTATYCNRRTIADSGQSFESLSDFWEIKYASGLGMVLSYYYADNGSSHYNDYSMSLVYYHQGNIICGNYDSTWFTVSVPKVTPQTDFKLYPNPVYDVLKIDGVTGPLFYVVYDQTGNVCSSGKAENELNVNALADGVYFVKIVSNNGYGYKRIIKTR